MINKIRKVWDDYQSTYHLAWIEKNYHRLNFRGKIIAKLFKIFYWISNTVFSITIFPLESVTLWLLHLEGIDNGIPETEKFVEKLTQKRLIELLAEFGKRGTMFENYEDDVVNNNLKVRSVEFLREKKVIK